MIPSNTAKVWAVQGAAMLSRAETTEVLARYARNIRPQSKGRAGIKVAEHQDVVQVAEPADEPDRAQRRDRLRRWRAGGSLSVLVEAERVPRRTDTAGDHVHAELAAPKKNCPAHERAGERHQDVLAGPRHVRWARPGFPAARCGPLPDRSRASTRSGRGPARARPGPAAGAPSQQAVAGYARAGRLAASDTAVVDEPVHDENDQADVYPDRSSEPTAETDRRPGQKIGHGLHPRSSAISARETSLFSPLESNLTAPGSGSQREPASSARATRAREQPLFAWPNPGETRVAC